MTYTLDNDLKLRERAQSAFPAGVYGHQASHSVSPDTGPLTTSPQAFDSPSSNWISPSSSSKLPPTRYDAKGVISKRPGVVWAAAGCARKSRVAAQVASHIDRVGLECMRANNTRPDTLREWITVAYPCGLANALKMRTMSR